ALGNVFLRGIEDALRLPVGQVSGVTALDAGHEFIPQAHVGERAPDHHLVVTAPGTVGVEVLDLHAVILQVLAGRRVGPDGPGRGNVVGGDRVPQVGQHP